MPLNTQQTNLGMANRNRPPTGQPHDPASVIYFLPAMTEHALKSKFKPWAQLPFTVEP